MDELFTLTVADLVAVGAVVYGIGQGIFWRMKYENLKDTIDQDKPGN